MTIQFSNNPGISVRICADLYRFAGSAQHGEGPLASLDLLMVAKNVVLEREKNESRKVLQ